LKQNLQEHDLEEELEESGPKIDLQLTVTMTKSITSAEEKMNTRTIVAKMSVVDPAQKSQNRVLNPQQPQL
jgi:hypothetical protein